MNSSINQVLVDQQHGFHLSRFTITCNLVLNSFIMDFYSYHSQVNVLLNTGFGDPLFSQFKSHLSDKTQRIKTYGICSDITVPSSGVPQGAILVQLLFLFIVNKTSLVLLYSKILIFVDEIKLMIISLFMIQYSSNQISINCLIN